MGFEEKPDPYLRRRQLDEVIGPLKSSMDSSSTALGCAAITSLPALWIAAWQGFGFGFWASGGLGLGAWIVLMVVGLVGQDRFRTRAIRLAVRAFDDRFPPGSPEYRDAMRTLAEARSAEKDTESSEALEKLYRALGGEAKKE